MKDEYICCLPGHERTPHAAPNKFSVSAGPGRIPYHFNVCPVGKALEDEELARMMEAYGLHATFNIWPPGRQDPKLLTAFVVIKREEDAITRETR